MLASQRADMVNFLMHDSFAQSFIPGASSRVDTVFYEQLLTKLTAGNLPLQRSIYPLQRWVEARKALVDSAKIRRLVSGFLVAQARSEEEQGNRIDRYALLIYQLIKSKLMYAALADTLFEHTRQRLEHAVNGQYYQFAEDRERRLSRAYFRYLMASANFMKAQEALAANNTALAERLLKAASEFSPDENDRLAKPAYFYESFFLFGSPDKEEFHKPYVDFLLNKGNTVAAVQVLTELTLADPGYINLLKTYYAKAPVSDQPFHVYWTKMLNAKLKAAEPFKLVDLDGKTFDYGQHKGKWVLIDFWGTWCKPCVEEFPRFQKFYNELVKANRQDLVVLTAACHDTETRVREFIQKQAYTFPVAMVNEAFIKQFRVSEYPTKVLITPQGNRMKIAFGANWAERIQIYTEN
ncbi:TlpA family protein disulfide reductase [Spirosoma fluminis]